jgi:3-hydroxyisobutyrate dehydrogenase-like beta-hydroxyacid dehydrogenase
MIPLIINDVAILGLGIIGLRACQRLSESGYQVRSWNRTPKRQDTDFATASEAIQSAQIISIYLKDSIAVRSIIAEIADQLQPGQIVLNHATVDLPTTLWFAEICAANGCSFLDAPFTGSKIAAENGQLFYYTGGDPALAANVQPYLSVTSRGQLHSGEVGTATVLKLATNLVIACTTQALAEALAIATSHGVASECLIQGISENACSSVLSQMKLPLMVAGDFAPHFALANMLKDTGYMLDLAAAAGLNTPSIAAVSQRLKTLCDAGLGDYDFSVLAKPYLQPA